MFGLTNKAIIITGGGAGVAEPPRLLLPKSAPGLWWPMSIGKRVMK